MSTSVKLSNGLSMPMLGLGMWSSPPDQVKLAINSALEAGYRHIDTAFIYGNEKEIGDALEEAMKRLNIKREELFITTKLWYTFMRPELVRKACERSLSDLRLSYVDLYLIHWPTCVQPSDGDPFRQENLDFDTVSHLDTWKAMEKLVDDGLVKSIGLSNFNRRQIDRIMKNCRIKPANLQVEIHANFPNTKLVDYAHSVGLSVTAYSPFGNPSDAAQSFASAAYSNQDGTNLLKASWVCEIAKRYNKTPGQVLLRYLLQRNLIVIPKSVTPSRIVENSKIFDFQLSNEDMQILNTKGLNVRKFELPWTKRSPEYPFNDEF